MLQRQTALSAVACLRVCPLDGGNGDDTCGLSPAWRSLTCMCAVVVRIYYDNAQMVPVFLLNLAKYDTDQTPTPIDKSSEYFRWIMFIRHVFDSSAMFNVRFTHADFKWYCSTSNVRKGGGSLFIFSTYTDSAVPQKFARSKLSINQGRNSVGVRHSAHQRRHCLAE